MNDRLNAIHQKHLSASLDREKLKEINEEIRRLTKEKQLIEDQIKELKKLIKSDKHRKYSMNIKLGFASKSNMFK